MNQKENKEFDLDDLWEEGLDELKVDKELAEIRKDLKKVLVHVTRLTKQELKGDIK